MNLKYKIRLWFSGLVMRLTLPIIFHRTKLEEMDLEGYFWVKVAQCRGCGQPINMNAIPGITEKEIRACLVWHLIRAHGGFSRQRLNGVLPCPPATGNSFTDNQVG